MMITKETASGGATRNNEDYNIPTGIYLCRLDDVVEIGPKADDEKKVPRIVFEFSVADGPYKGKKLSTFVKKNLYPGGKGKSNASHLYKLAKSFGVIDPMDGFDTTQFVGKFFTIVAKNDNDRAWPESIIPTSAPAATPSAPSAPMPPAPPGSVEPSDESRWQWCADGTTWQQGTGKEFKAWLMDKGADPAVIHATPENANSVKRASDWGFKRPAF